MLSNDLKVMLRVAAELFDRTSRVKDYLDRIGPGESNEHRQLSETIRRALKEIEQITIDSFAELWDIPDEYKDRAIATLQSNLLKFSRWFAKIHELLVFLPRESINPELIFTLKECYGSLYDQNHSIVLGSLFNAFEFDFVEILKERLTDISEVFQPDERNIVLQLAICDAYSPLAYAILGHEFGHAIDSQNNISFKVARQFVTDPNTKEFNIVHHWGTEFCADLVAARTLGPSPILSLLSMEYCLFPLHNICNHNNSHPMTRTRLEVVLQDLSGSSATSLIDLEINAYKTAWEAKFEQTFPDFAKRKIQIESQENLWKALIFPMVELIRQEISSISLPKANFEKHSIKRCIQRLRSNSPISAQGEGRESLRKRLEAHRQDSFASQEKRVLAFKKLIDGFSESPLEIPKILLSGHIHRSEPIENLYTSTRPFGDKESVMSFCKSMSNLDRLIGGSIITTSVHKELLNRIKKEGDA